ncbi:MAG: hypothetical protein WBV94_05355 [Blastocatellia bacterium]
MPAGTTSIRLIFKGLFVSCIKDGRAFAEVGLIRSAAEHRLGVTISVEGGGAVAIPPDFNPEENISIEVENTSKTGIRVFTDPDFNRETGAGNARDFRWFVDLESEEFYNKKLGVKSDQISPIIRINNAEFSAGTRTDINAVKKTTAETTLLGKIGLEVIADIELDKPESTAILKSGSREILKIEGNAGPRYVIEFDSDCKGVRPASDFTLAYRAISYPLEDHEKIDIAPEPVSIPGGNGVELVLIPIFTPALRCSGFNLSVTESLSNV